MAASGPHPLGDLALMTGRLVAVYLLMRLFEGSLSAAAILTCPFLAASTGCVLMNYGAHHVDGTRFVHIIGILAADSVTIAPYSLNDSLEIA